MAKNDKHQFAKDADENTLAALLGGAHALTFGLGDELLKAPDAMLGTELEEGYERIRAENPGAALTGELAAGFVPLLGWAGRGASLARAAARGGAGGTIARALNLPMKAIEKGTGGALGRIASNVAAKLPARDAALGAGYGFAYGLGDTEGGIGDRLEGAAANAALGGTTGAATGPLLRKLLGSSDAAGRHALRRGNKGFDKVAMDTPVALQGDYNRNVLSQAAKRLRSRQFDELDAGGVPTGGTTDVLTTVKGLERAGEAGKAFRAGSETFRAGREAPTDEMFPFVPASTVGKIDDDRTRAAFMAAVDNYNWKPMVDRFVDDPLYGDVMSRHLERMHLKPTPGRVRKLATLVIKDGSLRQDDRAFGQRIKEAFPELKDEEVEWDSGFIASMKDKENVDLSDLGTVYGYLAKELREELKDMEQFWVGPKDFMDSHLLTPPTGSIDAPQGADTLKSAKDVAEGYGHISGLIDIARNTYSLYNTLPRTRIAQLEALKQAHPGVGSRVKYGGLWDREIPNPTLSDEFSPLVDIYSTAGYTAPSKVAGAGGETPEQARKRKKLEDAERRLGVNYD